MHLNKRYHRLTATLLLVVYVFIATPVQLWHHHDPVEASLENVDQKRNVFTDSNDLLSERNCSICHHQYSTYHDDVIIPAVPDPREFSSKNGYYTPALVYAPSFSFQNKGPPFLT
ncbi:MAG: hypothetical protein QM763_14590 [Agriterribacter sp.]